MSALWGHRGDGTTETWWAHCAECQWEASANELAGADAVMTVASLTRQHNAEFHDWESLSVPA